MKPVDLAKSTAFMMSMALIIALLTNFAGVFPSDVLDSDLRADITVLLLAVMMTLSLSRYRFSNLNPVTHWRSVGRALLMGLIVSSLIPLAGYFLLKDSEWGAEAAGLVFIAATPFAASVAPLSYILRGDMEHAARGTIYVYVASLLWIPFVVWLAMGESVDMASLVITVVEIIGIPLVVSRLLTRFEISRDLMSVFLNCCIFVLVWLSVGSTNFSTSTVAILVAFAVIAIYAVVGRHPHLPSCIFLYFYDIGIGIPGGVGNRIRTRLVPVELVQTTFRCHPQKSIRVPQNGIYVMPSQE